MRLLPYILVLSTALAAQDAEPFLRFRIGRITVQPSGFYDQIAEYRTEPTGDTISTRFGRFPLSGGPAEWITSANHSRLMSKEWMDAGKFQLSMYYEMDFLGATMPYRLRQWFGEASRGKWHLIAGRTWGMLRPNRWGMEGDRDVWNTDVIEPQYHIGLVGFRKEEVRVSRYDDNWGIAVSAERRTEKTGVDGLVKVMKQAIIDGKRYHFEATGIAGGGRSGMSFSAIVPVTSKLQFVTQEYFTHKALSEALAVVTPGVGGTAFIQGLEAKLTKNLELYGYGGVAFGDRAETGNHHVQGITGGIQRKFPMEFWHGTTRTCLQVSHLNRDIWTGRSGSFTQVFLQLRYDLP